MKFFAAISLAGLVLSGANGAWGQAAQAPAAARSQVAGIVTAVDAAASQVTLKTAKGDTVAISTSDKTQIVHAQPGETDTKKWPKMAVSEIGVGDEALAMFKGALDQKPLLATSLVVRTKGDLSQLAQKELEDWNKRGTTGTVTAIDPAAKTITIKAGQKTYTLQPSDKTEYHRYSLDSAKASDAKPSTFAEVKTGDQLKVLGNKTEDGNGIKAESIYAGTFRQIAATIVSIDVASGEMKVTDLATKKPLIIKVNADSTMKKLSDVVAQGLARRYGAAAGARGGGGDGASAGPRGGGGGAPGGGRGGFGPPGGGPPGGGRGGGDIGQMLERLPAMPLSDLKPKDAIMVSTTMGTDPTRVTAIMLLAGVEPILTAAPNATRDIMSGWNLGGGGGGEGN
jgi:hypothetical protein